MEDNNTTTTISKSGNYEYEQGTYHQEYNDFYNNNNDGYNWGKNLIQLFYFRKY